MTATSSTVEWLTKKLYAKGLDRDALSSGNAMLSHVDHDTDFATAGNQVKAIPVPYVNGQGIGPTNATAYTARSAVAGEQFEVPQRRMIHFGEINADVVRNTEAAGSESQFINVFMREIDGATENFGQEINQRLYGSVLGGRSLVHASTAPSTTTLTLENPEDAQLYEPGMLVAAVETSSGNLRNSGAAVLVTKVDPIAGTLTGSTNWTTTIGALAVGDTLIRAGFHNLSLDGLSGWVPVTVSGSDSFMGVNRSVYRTRLAGVYADVSSLNIRSAFLRANAIMQGQIGGKFKKQSPVFMNPADVAHIEQSVEATRVVDVEIPTQYGVGLKGIQVYGQTIVADRHAPLSTAWMVPKGAFTFATAGNQPKIEQIDGKRFHYNRQTGLVEFTLAADGNSYSTAINSIGRVKLPTRPV